MLKQMKTSECFHNIQSPFHKVHKRGEELQTRLTGRRGTRGKYTKTLVNISLHV